jgi:hypothetical protein
MRRIESLNREGREGRKGRKGRQKWRIQIISPMHFQTDFAGRLLSAVNEWRQKSLFQSY